MEQLEKDMSVVMEVLADIAETIDRGTETIHNITVSQCHCASKQRLMLDVIQKEVGATVGVFEETMDNLEEV